MTRAERVAAGKCGFCGKLRKRWRWLCDECAERHKERQRVKTARLRLEAPQVLAKATERKRELAREREALARLPEPRPVVLEGSWEAPRNGHKQETKPKPIMKRVEPLGGSWAVYGLTETTDRKVRKLLGAFSSEQEADAFARS